MLQLLSADQSLPFSVSLAIMFGIAFMEGVSTLLGAGLSHLIDALIPDLHVDAHLADMDGHGAGALVLPVLHEIIPVNMNTLRLEVRRADQQALITRDRMRVDVTAEFYVRVKPSEDSIANAAQTLGMKTMNPDMLKELVEGKFVDALRAVAAEMAMTELHEKRVDFVQKVQQVVSEDRLKNGLELEAISLTGLDQTGKEFFNPDNAFDAEGLTKLTEEIEARRKKRNDIEQDTNVAIANNNLEAERLTLDIRREEEYARLSQEREVEVRHAEQVAEIASERARKHREAPEAVEGRPAAGAARAAWPTSWSAAPCATAARRRWSMRCSRRSGSSPTVSTASPKRSTREVPAGSALPKVRSNPDLAGWLEEHMPELPRGHRFEIPPDWVCEVLSPTTARKDWVLKMPV